MLDEITESISISQKEPHTKSNKSKIAKVNKNSIIDQFLFSPIMTTSSPHDKLLLEEKVFTKHADFMIDFYNNYYFSQFQDESIQIKYDVNNVLNCFQLTQLPQNTYDSNIVKQFFFVKENNDKI